MMMMMHYIVQINGSTGKILFNYNGVGYTYVIPIHNQHCTQVVASTKSSEENLHLRNAMKSYTNIMLRLTTFGFFFVDILRKNAFSEK